MSSLASTLGSFTATIGAAFDAAYAASFPPPVQLLLATPVDQRGPIIQELLAQGVPLDYETMIAGADAYLVMIAREAAGYTWTPSATMSPIPVAPGINYPGLPSYQPNNPPPGSFKVSTSAADFPPFTPPAPAAPPAPVNVVGAAYAPGSTMYMTGPGYQPWLAQGNANGSTINQGGVTYKLVQYETLPGLWGAYFVVAD